MLPPQVFFAPTKPFLEWFRDTPWLRYRRVIECGAGMGLLSQLLSAAGQDIHPIDLLERPGQTHHVEIADATTYDFEWDDVVLIARPCHNGWAEDTFRRALTRHGCTTCLYIGLPKNLESDLPDDDWERERLMEGVGQEGEELWRVWAYKPKARDAVEYEGRSWGWLRKNEARGEFELVNSAGGYMPIKASGITNTRKLHDLDAIFYDPKEFERNEPRAREGSRHNPGCDGEPGRYGWLAPDAIFYPCGSRDHETLIHRCFGIDSRTMAKQGWIKCYGSFFSREHYRDNKKPLTRKLGKALEAEGYKVTDFDYERGLDDLPADERAAARTARRLDGD